MPTTISYPWSGLPRYSDTVAGYFDSLPTDAVVTPPPIVVPPASLTLVEAQRLYGQNKLSDLKTEYDTYTMQGKEQFIYAGYKYVSQRHNAHGTIYLRHSPVGKTHNNYTISNIIERNEADMFASRKEDDGAIRLCIRRGRVIKSTQVGDSIKNITFATAALAKQCSDELNEKYFDRYDTFLDRENHLRRAGVMPPADLVNGMLEVISKYATLTEDNGSTGN